MVAPFVTVRTSGRVPLSPKRLARRLIHLSFFSNVGAMYKVVVLGSTTWFVILTSIAHRLTSRNWVSRDVEGAVMYIWRVTGDSRRVGRDRDNRLVEIVYDKCSFAIMSFASCNTRPEFCKPSACELAIWPIVDDQRGELSCETCRGWKR